MKTAAHSCGDVGRREGSANCKNGQEVSQNADIAYSPFNVVAGIQSSEVMRCMFGANFQNVQCLLWNNHPNRFHISAGFLF